MLRTIFIIIFNNIKNYVKLLTNALYDCKTWTIKKRDEEKPLSCGAGGKCRR